MEDLLKYHKEDLEKYAKMVDSDEEKLKKNKPRKIK